MKITGIRSVVVNAGMRWIFVRVDIDQSGPYGCGEATPEWKTRAVVGAVEDLSPLVLGRDPRDIEPLVRVMHKHGFWRIGGIGSSAIMGIEVALWDILGKSLGMPVWRLLGGRNHGRVRVYPCTGHGTRSGPRGSRQPTPAGSSRGRPAGPGSGFGTTR